MLTPKPFPLNLIIMGNSQVAIDSVGCHIIGLDPMSVDHIRLAAERGFGTVDLDAIKLSGDVSLDEAKKRARGFKVGLIRIEKYFEGTKISAYAGPPPEPERTDYCWGGCPGAFQEAIEVLRLYDAQCDDKLPRMHIVFGAYEGDIPAQPGEKVIFIGDCAKWRGELAGEFVQIESLYRDRTTKDPHSAKHDDIFVKMATVTGRMWKAESKSHVRLAGCPVSVAEQVLAVVQMGEVRNPYLDPRNAMPFQKSYFQWRAHTTAQRLRGQPYQQPGPCHRGEAAPHVDGKEPKV